jgi:hypothetical protein
MARTAAILQRRLQFKSKIGTTEFPRVSGNRRPSRQELPNVRKNLQTTLGVAIVLVWVGTALNPAWGQNDCPPVTFCNHDTCLPGTGVILGGELHILRPVGNDDPGVTTTTTPVPVRNDDPTTIQSFGYKFQAQPSVWFGYRTQDGLGFTATWFHLNESADTLTATASNNGATIVSVVTPLFTFAPAFPGTTTPFTFNSDIKMDIWDFDVSQTVQVGGFDLIFGGGIRYMHMGQDYSVFSNVPAISFIVGPGVINGTASNSFDGGGPTLLLNGLRRFGNSGIGLYANARAGVLFGAKRESTSLNVTPAFLAGFLTGGATSTSTVSNNESTIGFGEIELGVEWTRRMGNFWPFARLGFEGREYWGIGNAVNATTGNNSGNVGLYGLGLSAGIGF